MWMRAQTAVNDMFEIKINELECFLSLSERRTLMRVIADAKTEYFKQKAAFSFIKQRKKKHFKDILFKEKQNKECDRKKGTGIILCFFLKADSYLLTLWEMLIITLFARVKAKEFRKLLTIICHNYGSPLALLTLQPRTAS